MKCKNDDEFHRVAEKSALFIEKLQSMHIKKDEFHKVAEKSAMFIEKLHQIKIERDKIEDSTNKIIDLNRLSVKFMITDAKIAVEKKRIDNSYKKIYKMQSQIDRILHCGR
jgi:hypothetical protein